MGEFNTLNILAGLAAYGVAVLLGAGPLMYLAFKVSIGQTSADEEELLAAGKRAVGIVLGARLVCQAILIRHAVPAVMDVVRTLFAYNVPLGEALALTGRSALFAAFIIGLALFSVWFAGYLFSRLTRKIKEDKEVYENDNVAVAIFFALVLLAITLVLDEGMQELASSFVPFGRTGELD